MQEIYQEQVGQLDRQLREERHQHLEKAERALRENDRDPEACCEVARCLQALQQRDRAITVLREGMRRCAPSLRLYRNCIWALEESNRTEEAIGAAQEAVRLFPGDFFVKLKEALLLPLVYQTAAEIEHYRNRYAEGLRRLHDALVLDTAETRANALEAMGSYANTNLAYQCRDDRDLQQQYGQLTHRIMAANYPDWVKPVPMPPAPAGEKLRIGYVSSRFRNLSAAKYFLGWMREHDRARFAVHAYHTGSKSDAVTGEVRRISQKFQHLPDDLESACRAILADDLHILVFLDVGLNPIMTQLASLRLAPVQCVAWDQPVTSGLPTVDYFLSSALTEPVDGPGHYSERLVCLPGIGVCYTKPVIPKVLLTKKRGDFQLPEDAVVYLCCQLALKWLPQQDEVFVRIAQQVPHAVFLFLTTNEAVSADLQRRLDGVFSAAGLRAATHCVLMPEVDRFSYWNLNLIGDVFLDPMGWTGGVSTFEAIACPVPVVTMTGDFMRGRQSAAILTQLGVTETIAGSEAEYVRIAVRLGLDPACRIAVNRRMVEGHPRIYGDTRSVRALEEFYECVTEPRP